MTSHQTKKNLLYLLVLKYVAAVFSNQCGWDEYKCVNTNKCIDSEYMCDGDNDCGDWSDESAYSCGILDGILPTTLLETSPCKDIEFDCSDKCIPRGWLCDGEVDCNDGIDEKVKNCLNVPVDDSTMTDEQTTNPTVPRRPEFTTPDLNPPRTGDYIRFFNPDENFPTSQNPKDSIETDIDFETMTFSYYYHTVPRTERHTTTPSSIKTVTSTVTDTEFSDNAENNLDNCDPQADSQSIFSWSYWMEIFLCALGFIMVIVIIAIICRKRRMHVTTLNPKRNEQRQVVSFLNTPTTPECQLVLVGSAVNLQPAVLQPLSSSNPYQEQPPPYNTKATDEMVRNSMRNSEGLV